MMMTKRFLVAALGLFFCLTPTLGQAALAAGDRSAFDETDRDGDGSIDHEEYRLRMVETFYFLDENGDGYLVIKEIPGISEDDITDADENGDRRFDMNEFLVIRFLGFTAADSNGDGALGRGEVDAMDARQ